MNDWYIAPGDSAALDDEEHGRDCVERFPTDCVDAACENGSGCRVDKDILHMCASPEHFPAPDHEDT
jgi:hypothetical protein